MFAFGDVVVSVLYVSTVVQRSLNAISQKRKRTTRVVLN
jgi:hypothetical protein